MRLHVGYRSLASACALVLICVASRAGASQGTATFDTYAPGTTITNQYQSIGLRFSSSGLPCLVMLDPDEATSGANILIGQDVYSDIDIQIVDPVTGLPSPTVRACFVSLQVISAGWSVVEVTSKDSNGAVLESHTVTHPSGPVNGLHNADLLEFQAGGIASVSMHFTEVDISDGIGIDDVRVLTQSDCITPVAPSTWGRLKLLYR